MGRTVTGEEEKYKRYGMWEMLYNTMFIMQWQESYTENTVYQAFNHFTLKEVKLPLRKI